MSKVWYVGDFFQRRVQVLDVNKQESTPVPESSTLLGLVVLGAGKLRYQQQTAMNLAKEPSRVGIALRNLDALHPQNLMSKLLLAVLMQ